MAVTEKEALASLKILVAIAKADGALANAEREVFEQALKGVALPGGVSSPTLLDGTYDVGTLAADITSQEGRDAAFSSAFAMAYADRHCHPTEQALLDRLEKAWAVPKERKGLFGRIYAETVDTVSLSAIKPIADPVERKRQVDQDVMKYSVLSGVLGLNPIPIASIATDVAVVGVQAKMFRDIGQYWGRETTKDMTKQFLAGVGVGTGARIAVNNLLKFIPGVGSVVAASTNFASTWALGKVSNQYWESGGKADMKMLRELFVKSQAEGKKEYEAHKSDVTAKQAANRKVLDQLASDYKDGKLTQAEYERQVIELK